MEYFRLEFSMAAVRRDDFAALQKELDALRTRFCKGGSFVGIGHVQEGTKIND